MKYVSYVSHFTVDGKIQLVTRWIGFNRRSAAYFDVTLPFWPKLKEHTKTFSKEQDDLLFGNRCQHAKHTRLGFETISILGGLVTVQTTVPPVGIYFSINVWENNVFKHLTRDTYTLNLPTALWGWVEQVSASWATPAQRVIWYANKVDPWSRSDRAAIC